MGTQEESGYMACLRCGKLMPAGASFCNSCGADLSAAPAPGLQGAVSPERFKGSLQSGRSPEAVGPTPVQPAVTPVLYPAEAPVPTSYPPQQAAATSQYPPMMYRKPRTDGVAVASLVAAMVSFVAFPLFPAIAAIVMGFSSRDHIRKSEGELGGKGLALAGILVGVANIVFVVFIVLIAVIKYV